MTILKILGLYLAFGAVALGTFDILTKRIMTQLDRATQETQDKMINTGNYLSIKQAKITFLCLMWLTWPAVFIGAITDKKEDKKGG